MTITISINFPVCKQCNVAYVLKKGDVCDKCVKIEKNRNDLAQEYKNTKNSRSMAFITMLVISDGGKKSYKTFWGETVPHAIQKMVIEAQRKGFSPVFNDENYTMKKKGWTITKWKTGTKSSNTK